MQVYVCVWARLCVSVCVCVYSVAHSVLLQLIQNMIFVTQGFLNQTPINTASGLAPNSQCKILGARLSMRNDGQSSALCYNPKQPSALYQLKLTKLSTLYTTRSINLPGLDCIVPACFRQCSSRGNRQNRIRRECVVAAQKNKEVKGEWLLKTR